MAMDTFWDVLPCGSNVSAAYLDQSEHRDGCLRRFIGHLDNFWMNLIAKTSWLHLPPCTTNVTWSWSVFGREKVNTVSVPHACLMETQDNTDAVTLVCFHQLQSITIPQHYSLDGAKPFFPYTLVSPKCDQEATKQTGTNTEAGGVRLQQEWGECEREKGKEKGGKERSEVGFLTLLERRDTRPPQRAQNLVWQ